MERPGLYKKNVYVKALLSLLVVCALIFGCQFGSSPAEEERAAFSLRFYPSSVDIKEDGDITTIRVMIDQASNLFAIRFTVSFDPSIVEVTRVQTSGDGFIFTDTGAEVSELENNFNNESGRIVVGIGALKEGFTGASGSGSLAALWFRSKTAGESDLNFVDVEEDDIIASVYSTKSNTGWVELAIETFKGTIVVKEAE